MRQVWISRAGPPEVLEVRASDTPTPPAGELRLEVRAAGVNFADLMARMGMYQDGPPPPCVVGYEVSGVIDAVGEGVDPSWVGRRVVAATRFGGYSSHVLVGPDAVAPLPDDMSFSTAAAIPVTGLTAWMILEEMHRVREGDRILVHSAGGGVGLMACDLIKRRGATAVGTASAGKHAFLKDWGYDELVDYRSQDYEEVLGAGPEFDLVMDPLGGHNWAKGLRLLKTGGKLACYGMSVNAQGKVGRRLAMLGNILRIPFIGMNPVSLINGNKAVLGVNMGRMWDEKARLVGWLQTLVGLVDSGELRVTVHAEVPFDEAPEAHRILHDRENLGKVLLIP